MKKPLSRWAIAMWVIAVLFIAGQVSETVWMIAHFGAGTVWRILQSGSALMTIAVFAGLGVLIETTDQIRWQLRSLAERLKALESAKL